MTFYASRFLLLVVPAPTGIEIVGVVSDRLGNSRGAMDSSGVSEQQRVNYTLCIILLSPVFSPANGRPIIRATLARLSTSLTPTALTFATRHSRK